VFQTYFRDYSSDGKTLKPQEVQAFIVQNQHGDPIFQDIEKLKLFMEDFTQKMRRSQYWKWWWPDEEPYFTIKEV